MKRNHIEVEQAIQKAIHLCWHDFAMQETTQHLRRALNSLSDVSQRRNKRQSKIDEYKAIAMENQKKWWDQIVENAKKSAEVQLERKKEPGL
jgi:hypothetical protein